MTNWITAIILSLIICSGFTFIIYQTGIEEWWLMGIISLVVSILLIRGIMYCMEVNNRD